MLCQISPGLVGGLVLVKFDGFYWSSPIRPMFSRLHGKELAHVVSASKFLRRSVFARTFGARLFMRQFGHIGALSPVTLLFTARMSSDRRPMHSLDAAPSSLLNIT